MLQDNLRAGYPMNYQMNPPPFFFFFYHGPALSGPTMTLSLLPFVQETKLKTLLKRREADFTGIFGALW